MLKSLIDFAIERRVTIVMFTVAIALFGFVSLSRLKLNLLPDLSYPTITIRTELPGAAPLEVETLISRPVEETVSIIRNVREVRSVSRAGQSDVTLEFVWGTDMDIAGIDVREKLDLLQLPLEAKRPLLLRFDPSSEPVLRLALLDEAAVAGSERTPCAPCSSATRWPIVSRSRPMLAPRVQHSGCPRRVKSSPCCPAAAPEKSRSSARRLPRRSPGCRRDVRH